MPLQPRIRQAMRAEVARVAWRLFIERGFDNVTAAEIASEAGVSRATFFRYFGGKEDPVLVALDEIGVRIADTLMTRPAGEDAWTALRRAFDVAIDEDREDHEWALARTLLVLSTPSLRAREREKHRRWHALLVRVLTDRLGLSEAGIEVETRVAAALAALETASSRWAEAGGEEDLGALLDQAFHALRTPGAPLR